MGMPLMADVSGFGFPRNQIVTDTIFDYATLADGGSQVPATEC